LWIQFLGYWIDVPVKQHQRDLYFGMLEELLHFSNRHPERLKNIPAQRAGRAEEIAKVAVFLASDDASYLQGSEVTADGGWNIGR
jgi:NAD(P)-dependent dehydrogenase (short-subunit alcohol dehydrogenase family)